MIESYVDRCKISNYRSENNISYNGINNILSNKDTIDSIITYNTLDFFFNA